MHTGARQDDGPAAPAATDLSAVVLVEGASDRLALETLARRRGRDLRAERVAVVAMGGATNISRFLDLWGPGGRDVRLAGLCDAGEAPAFRRALHRSGLGSDLTREDMARLGFHTCVDDLEDELIRTLGASRVGALVAAQGEGGALRTFRRQPAWRGRPPEEQLRRFLGTQSGRKIRYGRLLVEALDLDDVPRPLDGVLDQV